MSIRRLEEAVIRKIAAGEVVDRPGSVAKELVENSLDAGGTRISVEVLGGGIDVLRVHDDGAGMAPDEMRLAVERHTTSKLVSEDDLLTIRTLGFRGEALAAICAVARVSLTSRTEATPGGHEIHIEGGQIAADRPAAHPVGTTVTVEDLFWNVPARRQFLDAPAVEARRLLSTLRRIVLARPAVAFTIRSEDRPVLDVSVARDTLARIADVYGDTVAGRLVGVEMEELGFRLLGWFGPPELARPTRVDQHLFLSGRSVRPGILALGIAQAYSRYLPRGQHPAFFLYLDADPNLVDVNVHPRKEEVRFRSDRSVMDLLRRAALRAVGGHIVTPTWAARPEAPQGDAQPPDRRVPVPLLLSAKGAAPPLGPWRVLGQALGRYLVVEGENGLEIVDQHAAHERVLFERSRDGTGLPTQEFLVPVQIEVPFDRAETLRRAIPTLQTIGVHLEAFGEHTFLLRGWPAPLADRQSRLGFEEPIAAVGSRLLDSEPPVVELWREVACAAAIRAGELLSPQEQEVLIRDWKSTREPARCPHGRPVVLRLSWEVLASQLGR